MSKFRGGEAAAPERKRPRAAAGRSVATRSSRRCAAAASFTPRGALLRHSPSDQIASSARCVGDPAALRRRSCALAALAILRARCVGDMFSPHAQLHEAQLPVTGGQRHHIEVPRPKVKPSALVRSLSFTRRKSKTAVGCCARRVGLLACRSSHELVGGRRATERWRASSHPPGGRAPQANARIRCSRTSWAA